MPVSRDELLRAAELIRAGKLVAFPTETVYGLGANALDPEAVRRIFAAKGRPSTSPLIVHVASIRMARDHVVSNWPAAAERLAQRFWPGPLTLVLPKRAAVPDEVTAGLPTVGVRQPAHPVAADLIEAAGVPIAAPSANRFTELSPTTADHVRAALGNYVDLILDGGPSNVGIESTVLSLAGSRPVLLRPGMVTQTEIESVIGPVERVSTTAGDSGAHPSPGLHPRHYSPRTRLIVGGQPGSLDAWLYHRCSRPEAGKQIRLPSDPSGYAEQLYRTLHELDAENWSTIFVEPVPDGSDWDGVRDRLNRASVT